MRIQTRTGWYQTSTAEFRLICCGDPRVPYLHVTHSLTVRNILQKSFVSHICFAKDFPLFSIRRIAFAKLRSFAHHANILVDLGPPKPGYLIAASPKPPNRLARWRTASAKRSYFRMGLMKRKIGPYGPSPFLSALDSINRWARDYAILSAFLAILSSTFRITSAEPTF